MHAQGRTTRRCRRHPQRPPSASSNGRGKRSLTVPTMRETKEMRTHRLAIAVNPRQKTRTMTRRTDPNDPNPQEKAAQHSLFSQPMKMTTTTIDRFLSLPSVLCRALVCIMYYYCDCLTLPQFLSTSSVCAIRTHSSSTGAHSISPERRQRWMRRLRIASSSSARLMVACCRPRVSSRCSTRDSLASRPPAESPAKLSCSAQTELRASRWSIACAHLRDADSSR